MKLTKISAESFQIQMSQREFQMFTAVLDFYPLLNPDYHQVTKTPGDEAMESAQQLLQEAMTEERAKNKKRVSDFLAEENWQADGRMLQTKLNAEAVEWLLQVLNDVRVGSWVKLGKPDSESGEKADLTLEKLPYAGAMDLSGYFQSMLLQALQS